MFIFLCVAVLLFECYDTTFMYEYIYFCMCVDVLLIVRCDTTLILALHNLTMFV